MDLTVAGARPQFVQAAPAATALAEAGAWVTIVQIVWGHEHLFGASHTGGTYIKARLRSVGESWVSYGTTYRARGEIPSR
jgi:hypothetical protein